MPSLATVPADNVIPLPNRPPPGGDATIPFWYGAIPGPRDHHLSLVRGDPRAARLRSRPDTRRSQGFAVTTPLWCGAGPGRRAQHPSPSSCLQAGGWCHPFPPQPLYPGGNGPIPPWERCRPLGGPAASLPIAEAIPGRVRGVPGWGRRRPAWDGPVPPRGGCRTRPGMVAIPSWYGSDTRS
jgi:hypothetical protein